MNFPNKCVRCGFCCLVETCPKGQSYHGIGLHDPCPSLRFNGNVAKCSLVKKDLIPIGDGCCISARAFKDGVQYDFASLPKKLKIRSVKDFKKGIKT